MQSPSDIDGTWLATVGSHRTVIAVKACDDGKIIGILPGEPTIEIDNGTIIGSNVTINFSGEDGGGELDSFSFTGILSGDVLTGYATVDGSLISVTFNRVSANYQIQFMELVDQDVSSSYPDAEATLLFNVISRGGRFIGGGFTGFHSCEFIACGGMIEDLSVNSTTGEYTIETVSSNIDGTMVASWNSAGNMLEGTWSSINSSGHVTNGDFIGGQRGIAESDSFDSVLGLLTTFANGVEGKTLLASDIFDASYTNDGVTPADWDARLTTWFNDYDNLEVEIGPITTLVTHNTGIENLYIRRVPQIEAIITVTGDNVITGATETIYTFNPSAVNTELSLISTSPTVKFIGNGASNELALELPFDHTLADLSTNVIWPYGVHGGGHPEGHPGIDMWMLPGTSITSATDGTVVMLEATSLMIECRRGLLIQYEHLDNIDPSLAIGSIVTTGQYLATPEDDYIHLGIRHGIVTEPPFHWTPTAQINFDALWDVAAWPQEISEPLLANKYHIDFPHTVEWVNNNPSGMPAIIELTDLSPFDYDHSYRLIDTSGTVYDFGTVDYQHRKGWLDFGLNLGLCKIVGGEMQLKIDSIRPTSLSGADTFTFVE